MSDPLSRPQPSKPRSPVRLTPRQRSAVDAFLDSQDAVFRRAHLIDVLHPLISPRSRPKAEALADLVLKEMSRAGRVRLAGSVHWEVVSVQRRLLDGRPLPELKLTVEVSMKTRVPGKWFAVDGETGDVWCPDGSGWRRAAAADLRLIADCVSREQRAQGSRPARKARR